MEFWIGIFNRGFWVYTRVFSDSSFFLVFYPHFSVLQNVIHEKTGVFLFRGLWNQRAWMDCEKYETKDSSLLLNWCPRIPSLAKFTKVSWCRHRSDSVAWHALVQKYTYEIFGCTLLHTWVSWHVSSCIEFRHKTYNRNIPIDTGQGDAYNIVEGFASH